MKLAALALVSLASWSGCGGSGGGGAGAAGAAGQAVAADAAGSEAETMDLEDEEGGGAMAAAPVVPVVSGPRTAPAVTATAAAPFEIDIAEGTKRFCDRDGYRAPADAKLELVGSQAASGRAVVNVALRNVGPSAVCIYSHIQTHELQSDWLRIQYSDGNKYHHVARVIELDDARDKSAPHSVLLAPGETLWTSIDLDQWAKRSRNGSEAIPSGSLYIEAIYETSGRGDVWAGRLVSAPFELKVK